MADKTRIEWTDATWNPVTGCTKVSAGCKHCYAERDWARLSANPQTRYYGREFTDVQCHPDVLDLPLRWTKPRRIFVNSMSDLFHPTIPIQFLDDVMMTMELAKHHTFQVLTKRPTEMLDALQRIGTPVPQNVWLGVSVEDQATADERIPLLLQAPATVRWISAEPLLGPIDLTRLPEVTCASECCGMQRLDALTGQSICDLSEQAFDKNAHIDWVVAGGESGPKARPMHPDWVRGLRDQCAAAGVPFLFKQWSEFWPAILDRKPPEVIMCRVGKKLAGRVLDGIEHNGYPETS